MACSQVKIMERKECVGITEKRLPVHSCSWAKTGTQLPPGFSADLPAAWSVSQTLWRSQLCCRGFLILRLGAKQPVSSVRLAGRREGGRPAVLFPCSAGSSAQAFQQLTLSEMHL